MDTVWVLQDDSDYYGPDFHAVFATEAAARAYTAKMDKGRRYPKTWQLEEVPLHHEPPRVETVYTFVAHRQFPWEEWRRSQRQEVETIVRHEFGVYPKVNRTDHLVRVDALDRDEAERLFAEEFAKAPTFADRDEWNGWLDRGGDTPGNSNDPMRKAEG